MSLPDGFGIWLSKGTDSIHTYTHTYIFLLFKCNSIDDDDDNDDNDDDDDDDDDDGVDEDDDDSLNDPN